LNSGGDKRLTGGRTDSRTDGRKIRDGTTCER